MAGDVGVIHEDCAGFGDGLGFSALNESEKEKVNNQSSSTQALNENKKEEEK